MRQKLLKVFLVTFFVPAAASLAGGPETPPKKFEAIPTSHDNLTPKQRYVFEVELTSQKFKFQRTLEVMFSDRVLDNGRPEEGPFPGLHIRVVEPSREGLRNALKGLFEPHASPEKALLMDIPGTGTIEKPIAEAILQYRVVLKGVFNGLFDSEIIEATFLIHANGKIWLLNPGNQLKAITPAPPVPALPPGTPGLRGSLE